METADRVPVGTFVAPAEQTFRRAQWRMLLAAMFCYLFFYLSLIHISEPTRPRFGSRMPSSA